MISNDVATSALKELNRIQILRQDELGKRYENFC